MLELICPICGSVLVRADRSFVCENRHSFDIARQGYVNLLTVQQKHSIAPGDTRQQVLSRRSFLEAGFYAPIGDALVECAKKYGVSGDLLDVGCGEGYYCTRLADALNLDLTGLDISKEAVRCAAAKYKNARWLCATAAHIPVPDASVDLLTSLFALTLPEEYRRVLKQDGLYFQVLAAQDHLMGLKNIIYDEILLKQKDPVPVLPGFDLLETIPIRFSFTARAEQVQNLFCMTPHVFRIGKDGARRLQQTQILSDTASCVLNVYRRT